MLPPSVRVSDSARDPCARLRGAGPPRASPSVHQAGGHGTGRQAAQRRLRRRREVGGGNALRSVPQHEGDFPAGAHRAAGWSTHQHFAGCQLGRSELLLLSEDAALRRGPVGGTQRERHASTASAHGAQHGAPPPARARLASSTTRSSASEVRPRETRERRTERSISAQADSPRRERPSVSLVGVRPEGPVPRASDRARDFQRCGHYPARRARARALIAVIGLPKPPQLPRAEGGCSLGDLRPEVPDDKKRRRKWYDTCIQRCVININVLHG